MCHSGRYAAVQRHLSERGVARAEQSEWCSRRVVDSGRARKADVLPRQGQPWLRTQGRVFRRRREDACSRTQRRSVGNAQAGRCTATRGAASAVTLQDVQQERLDCEYDAALRDAARVLAQQQEVQPQWGAAREVVPQREVQQFEIATQLQVASHQEMQRECLAWGTASARCRSERCSKRAPTTASAVPPRETH